MDKTERMSVDDFRRLNSQPRTGQKLTPAAPVAPTAGNLHPPVSAAYYIGIDPGVKTGFALWHARRILVSGRFVEVTTLTFWGAIQRIAKLVDEHGAGVLRVRIEDVRANKAMYGRHDGEGNAAVREKMSQNIGSNKRDCQLLIEYIESRGIPYDALPPRKRATGAGKVTAAYFSGFTGFPLQSSEHSRDAAYLVAGL